jgi:hypothetical protein
VRSTGKRNRSPQRQRQLTDTIACDEPADQLAKTRHNTRSRPDITGSDGGYEPRNGFPSCPTGHRCCTTISHFFHCKIPNLVQPLIPNTPASHTCSLSPADLFTAMVFTNMFATSKDYFSKKQVSPASAEDIEKAGNICMPRHPSQHGRPEPMSALPHLFLPSRYNTLRKPTDTS